MKTPRQFNVIYTSLKPVSRIQQRTYFRIFIRMFTTWIQYPIAMEGNKMIACIYDKRKISILTQLKFLHFGSNVHYSVLKNIYNNSLTRTN